MYVIEPKPIDARVKISAPQPDISLAFPITLGLSAWIVTLIVLFSGLSIATGGKIDNHSALLSVAYVVAIVVGILAFRQSRNLLLSGAAKTERRKVREYTQAELAKRRQSAEDEATSATARAYNLLQQTGRLLQKMNSDATAASAQIINAEIEFEKRAFDPYWDSVEVAAAILAGIAEDSRKMASNGYSYHSLLSGRKHTFPDVLYDSVLLPKTTPIVERLREVIRKSQTDVDFTLVRHHRKTENILSRGFGTITSGLADLEGILSEANEMATSAATHLSSIDAEMTAIAEDLRNFSGTGRSSGQK